MSHEDPEYEALKASHERDQANLEKFSFALNHAKEVQKQTGVLLRQKNEGARKSVELDLEPDEQQVATIVFKDPKVRNEYGVAKFVTDGDFCTEERTGEAFVVTIVTPLNPETRNTVSYNDMMNPHHPCHQYLRKISLKRLNDITRSAPIEEIHGRIRREYLNGLSGYEFFIQYSRGCVDRARFKKNLKELYYLVRGSMLKVLRHRVLAELDSKFVNEVPADPAAWVMIQHLIAYINRNPQRLLRGHDELEITDTDVYCMADDSRKPSVMPGFLGAYRLQINDRGDQVRAGYGNSGRYAFPGYMIPEMKESFDY